MRSSVKLAALVSTAMAGALVVGVACVGPDSPDTVITAFQGIASGFNITHASCTAVPPGATCGTDTSSSATINLTWHGGYLASASNSFTYTLSVGPYPATGITSVVLRNGTGVASALAGTVCTGAACPAAAGTITGTLTLSGNVANDTVLYRTLRNRTSYLRVVTSGEATGSALGNIGPLSP